MIGMLIDVTKCIGCESCVKACVEINKLEKYIPAPQHAGDGLSSNRFTSIIKAPGKRFVKKQCRHCKEPACASACLVGAMKKSAEGPVIYDKQKCMGCRYCMMACPYGIPRYDWDKTVPYVKKCTMCFERVTRNEQPACVEACPKEAVIFGKRDDLMKEAKQRIARDSKYLKKVYGEHEIGGTSVLYVSDISLRFLGWRKDLGNEPLPELTWHALTKVPAEFLGMGALMTGIYLFGERKKKVRAEKEVTNNKKNSIPKDPSQDDRKNDE